MNEDVKIITTILGAILGMGLVISIIAVIAISIGRWKDFDTFSQVNEKTCVWNLPEKTVTCKLKD